MSEKKLRWFRDRRNETILDMMHKHLETTTKAVNQLSEMVKTSGESPENKKAHNRSIGDYEHKANELRRDMIEELTKHEMVPEERDDLMELVRAVDWVADCCKAAGRLLYAIPFEKAPAEFRKSVEDMCVEDYNCVKLLSECIHELSINPKKALEIADQVENSEEKVDDLYTITRDHFAQIPDGLMSRGSMILLNEFIDTVETIADWCENSVDDARAIALRVI